MVDFYLSFTYSIQFGCLVRKNQPIETLLPIAPFPVPYEHRLSIAPTPFCSSIKQQREQLVVRFAPSFRPVFIHHHHHQNSINILSRAMPCHSKQPIKPSKTQPASNQKINPFLSRNCQSPLIEQAAKCEPW